MPCSGTQGQGSVLGEWRPDSCLYFTCRHGVRFVALGLLALPAPVLLGRRPVPATRPAGWPAFGDGGVCSFVQGLSLECLNMVLEGCQCLLHQTFPQRCKGWNKRFTHCRQKGGRINRRHIGWSTSARFRRYWQPISGSKSLRRNTSPQLKADSADLEGLAQVHAASAIAGALGGNTSSASRSWNSRSISFPFL